MNRTHFFFSGMWLIALFVFLRTLNQILFKMVALGPGGGSYLALVIQPLFYLTCIIFLAQAGVWLAVLRRLPLSRIYPFTSLTIITLLISGAAFFGEAVTLGNVLGALVIMAGVVVIGGGQV